MKDYYEILGVQRGASELEIKKMYFKQIRTFSPEDNPQKFKEIRAAYEYLKDEKNRSGDGEDVPEDSFARKMLERVKALIDRRFYYDGVDAAEEAIRIFPEEKVFLFYLAVCQREAGYTGKAVKSCEELVKEDPENIRYAREMAMAYAARGYRKKALSAFKYAYDRGCGDLDFVLKYSVCCDESRLWRQGRDVLLDTAERDYKWSREDLYLLIDVYAGLCNLNSKCMKDNRLDRIILNFSAFICRYAFYMEDIMDDAESVFSFLIHDSMKSWPDGRNKMEAAYNALEDAYMSPEAIESLGRIRMHLDKLALWGDDRIGDAIKYSWDAYSGFNHPDYEFESERQDMQKYGELDCQLLMMEEMPEILKEFDVLKEIAPNFYSKLSKFIDTLKSASDLTWEKNKLLKEYRRLSRYISGGKYFKLFPEMQQQENSVWNDDMPYVRQGKKIGRNDPCPCGSGKKYKQCCGKN